MPGDRLRVLVALALPLTLPGGVAAAARPPAPSVPVPQSAAALARALVQADAGIRQAAAAWRAAGEHALAQPTPEPLTLWALRQQRLVRRLRGDPPLARATLRRLPASLRGEVRDLVAAGRELAGLAADTPPSRHRLRVGPALPAALLRRHYAEAERRFGVPWTLLAAVNLVESGFGRVRSASSADAQGPMQFLPATWRAYGLGGDVHDPHDAILGAANYLHASGAPADPAAALFHYNPSRRYVDAVLRYARVMRRDPVAYLALHSWQVFVRRGHRVVRVTGPGTSVPSVR